MAFSFPHFTKPPNHSLSHPVATHFWPPGGSLLKLLGLSNKIFRVQISKKTPWLPQFLVVFKWLFVASLWSDSHTSSLSFLENYRRPAFCSPNFSTPSEISQSALRATMEPHPPRGPKKAGAGGSEGLKQSTKKTCSSCKERFI